MRILSSRVLAARFCEAIQIYGISSRIGGESAQGLYQLYAGKYENVGLLKMKPKIMSTYGTTILTTPQECQRCVEKLSEIEEVVAWDTETIDLDVKNESPVGKGRIICASFFAGPEHDFGNGPKVFIDNFGKNAGLLNIFKQYLESERHKKAWHNYSFDRHVFYNHGINVRGFAADTMHMARLYDSSKFGNQYSLAALTKEYKAGIMKIYEMQIDKKKKLYHQMLLDKGLPLKRQKQLEGYIKNLQKYTTIFNKTVELEKTKMNALFRRKKILRDGQQGKTYEFPSTLTLHTKQQLVANWIKYSVLDSESTYFLRLALQLALKNTAIEPESKKIDKKTKIVTVKSNQYGMSNELDIYNKYWRPFGECLTEMQRQGFKVDLEYMKSIQKQAIEKIEQKRKMFMDVIVQFQQDPNVKYFNPSSPLQMQQFLFAPFKVEAKPAKQSKQENQAHRQLDQLQNQDDQMPETEKRGTREPLTELPLQKEFIVEDIYSNSNNKMKKHKMVIRGLGLPPLDFTPTGIPSVDVAVLEKLAGQPKKQKYGDAYKHLASTGEPQKGKKLCQALITLIELRQLETLLKTFIQPLQTYLDTNNRVHCSLNINTETGRLSSRKPNLQNQPALEKDIFKIRSAFTCEKGNKLIVADYGQLQLRVLAHLADCKAMIQAFIEGGDFHSRTAIGMFDYIRKDIEQGKVLLQWDKSKGVAPAPLLKQKYAAERRKAKTVNFSIAYGKTAKGFAADWQCSQAQAKNIINSWFKDRPEVKKWQQNKQNIAKDKKYTQTLLGRYRRLDKFFTRGTSTKGNLFGMGLRRAINTPIQGGAADIVIAAMVKIYQNQELKKLGWKLLLQIHDELILQGPQSTVKEAFEIVKWNMSHPFQKDLLVELEVDAKIGNNWYECK